MSTIIHMCIDREGLIRNLRSGAVKASEISRGYSKRELIAHLESLTDRVLPFGEPCDRFDPEEGCLGHRADDESDGEEWRKPTHRVGVAVDAACERESPPVDVESDPAFTTGAQP